MNYELGEPIQKEGDAGSFCQTVQKRWTALIAPW
jgi:hypothetical protein